jgi:hypothetical protein
MVFVETSPELTSYQTHRALLLYCVGYFRGALQPCWKEDEERKIVIEDSETAPFDITWAQGPERGRLSCELPR